MELKVHEIFASIQGESTHVGEPCAFVRLTGCNLRCAWCDAAYALEGGNAMSLDAILAKVREIDLEYVELTGGEPLIQEGSIPLLEALVDDDFTVLLETNGTLDLSNVPGEVIKVMDVKCPSSAMCRDATAVRSRPVLLSNGGKVAYVETSPLRNVDFLSGRDEVKFVMADRADYDWAKQVLKSSRKFEHVHAVHFTPVAGRLDLGTLADWVLADKLPVRLGFQLHKLIWGADTKR